MKTSTFKYFGLALMAILMVSFTSCEVEIDSFYDDDNKPCQSFRMNFSTPTNEQIIKGVAILGALMHD